MNVVSPWLLARSVSTHPSSGSPYSGLDPVTAPAAIDPVSSLPGPDVTNTAARKGATLAEIQRLKVPVVTAPPLKLAPKGGRKALGLVLLLIALVVIVGAVVLLQR